MKAAPAEPIERCACGAVSGFECSCDVAMIEAMHYSGMIPDPIVDTMRLATSLALFGVGTYIVGLRLLTLILFRE